jgi:methionyl-tRNA formyltransferase
VTPRIVLAGNNLAAVYALDIVLDALAPEAVLVLAPTRTGRPAWQTSLADHARARGVATLTPDDVNAPEVLRAVESHEPDLLLSVYYTQLFRALLDAIRGRQALNFHPSLLPRHRGVAPLIWAIAEGDAKAGLTVHHIDADVDAGRIVMQRPLPIHRDDSGFSLHMKMAKLVRALTAELLRAYLDSGAVTDGVEQEGEASYHRYGDPVLNHIDWRAPRERVRNVVRALAPPLPGAYANVHHERLVVARVEPADRLARGAERPPGMVELVRGQPPRVWAGDGPVALVEYFHEGELRPGEELASSGRLAEGQLLT